MSAPRDPSGRAISPWLPWGAVVALYTFVTCVYFWPLPRLWQSHLGPFHDDPLFNLYVLKWGVHQIRLGLPDLWNANLFYPLQGTLTFSDHLVGPAAQLALFELIVPNAIAGYNFLFLTSYVASAWATCWVLRRSGLSWTAAILGGGMYAFSPFRLAQTPHLQILLAQWIPLTLWFWDRLLAERTPRRAAQFLLFYLLNLTGGCYFAYMVHFPLLAILVCRLREEGRALVSGRALRVLLPVALVAGLGIAWIFAPYVRVSRELGLARPPSEIEDYGATWASYLTPANANLYFGPRQREALDGWLVRHAQKVAPLFRRAESELFAGFLPTALLVVGAAAAWRERRRRPPDPWWRGLAWSGGLCFALTLTPVYRLLMPLIPGLSGMRAPGRFYAFVSLTLVAFAARGVDLLLARARGVGSTEVEGLVDPEARRWRWKEIALAAGLALVLAIELAPRRLAWLPLPREEELPKVYTYLRDDPSVHAILELPIYLGPQENAYLYASTVHWKPIVNGYSGHISKLHDDLTERLRFLPGPEELTLLRRLQVTHLVVHPTNRHREQALERWEKRFAQGPGRLVERVYSEEGSLVYRLIPGGKAP